MEKNINIIQEVGYCVDKLTLVSNDHIFTGLHPNLKLEDWSV